MPDLRRILTSDSDIHKRLAAFLRQKVRLSDQKTNQYSPFWRQADDALQYFAFPGSLIGKIDEEVELVIPLSYLSVMIKLGLLMSIYFGTRPIFPIIGFDKSDVRPAKYAEMLIESQINYNPVYYNHYIWFQDALKYGFGVNALRWMIKEEKIVRKRVAKIPFIGVEFPLPKVVERAISYEGNESSNIDPYFFLPDPRVPLKDHQKGEFCGYRSIELISTLQQLDREGQLFNTERLIGKTSDHFLARDRLRGLIADSPSGSSQNPWTDLGKDYTGITNIYIKLVPAKWGLTDSRNLETWFFRFSDDDFIIYAAPYTFDHFPINILESNPDGYSLMVPGEPAYLSGIEEFASWLLSSRRENVMKSLHEILLFDPNVINEQDLAMNQPGLRVKVNSAALLGLSLDSAFKHIPTVDVTVTHLQDMKFLISIFEMISGVSSLMLGSVTQTGRKSATEVRGATQLATLRTRLIAELFSGQGVRPHVRMMLMNNQALLSRETFARVVGQEAAEALQVAEGTVIRVEPGQLLGSYDLAPFDGTLPIDQASRAQTWFNVLSLISGNEVLLQEFDPVPIFREIAINIGAKNIDEYRRKALGLGSGLSPGAGNGGLGGGGGQGAPSPSPFTPTGGINTTIKVSAQPDERIEEQRRQGNLVSLAEELS